MPKPVLEARQQGLLVTGFDEDDPPWGETRLGDRRSEEVLTGDAPQDFALRPCGDPGGEKRRGRPVDRAIPAARDLVQGTEREAAARQASVDLRHTERQGLPNPRVPSLEPLDALAKVGQDGCVGQAGHWLATDRIPKGDSVAEYVPVLFRG